MTRDFYREIMARVGAICSILDQPITAESAKLMGEHYVAIIKIHEEFNAEVEEQFNRTREINEWLDEIGDKMDLAFKNLDGEGEEWKQ